MEGEDSLVATASLIADPTRAEMLLAMMDGRAFPATDLAAIANVSASTCSHHLAKLIEGGLVVVVQQGRHRYHRLANHRVGDMLESLGAFSTRGRPSMKQSNSASKLAHCRSCYDHLAGRVGVGICESLQTRGYIVHNEDHFLVTDPGHRFLSEFGVDLAGCRQTHRPLAKACIDWTERLPHVGSSLGKALLEVMLEKGWVERGSIPRLLTVTSKGEFGLKATFDLDLAAPHYARLK